MARPYVYSDNELHRALRIWLTIDGIAAALGCSTKTARRRAKAMVAAGDAEERADPNDSRRKQWRRVSREATS